MQNQFDVVILGGGLAGLTLAMQIKQSNAAINILIIERRKDNAPSAAHKVGESTVELGTYYLREVLGLATYLEENHLHKHGLRFFFPQGDNSSVENRVEYGAKNELFVPSHQIDRGIFENDMVRKVKALGVKIIMDASVKNVQLSDNTHSVTYTSDKTEHQISTKWVVDASGRANIMKRKENLLKDTDHNINAAWFRVKGNVDVASWSDNEEWLTQLNPGLRRLGTVHLMGQGYWVWLIPLSSGNTSVGIVADPRFHDFKEINTLDKAFNWLAEHEPQCAEKLSPKKEHVLDFRPLMNFSYSTTKFFATNNWGMIGEASAFLDPFYSPGTDFIAMGNTWMSDLICRDYEAEDIHVRSIVYDQVMGQLFNNWLPIYQDKYELFGNTQVMTVKITWDFAVYWAIPTLLYTNKGITNLNVLKVLFTVKNSFGERFGKLNKNMQDFYMQWGKVFNPDLSDKYFDPMSISFMVDLQKGIETIHTSDEELVAQLENNLSLLELFASAIISKATNGGSKNLINPFTSTFDDVKTHENEDNVEEKVLDMNRSIEPLWLK